LLQDQHLKSVNMQTNFHDGTILYKLLLKCSLMGVLACMQLSILPHPRPAAVLEAYRDPPAPSHTSKGKCSLMP